MDVKYQVFVSSTFVDLREERRSVIESILNLGHIPVGMEAFQASDDTQWEYIKRRIDESDYYVVIVAERYGSEEKGKSYTQMEYEYAVEIGVPVAAFLLDNVARKTWPAENVEFEKKKKIEQLRKLCQKKLVKFWKNSDDLGGKVALALNELTRQKPRTGWVRADSIPSKDVLEELSRLSEERRHLQSEVEKLSANNEKLHIPASALWLINDLKRKSVADFCFARGIEIPYTANLLDFFWEILPKVTSGLGTFMAQYELAPIIHVDDKSPSNELSYAVHDIFNEFVLANLIERRIQQTYSFEKPRTDELYFLTDYGKQFVMFAREASLREIQAAGKGNASTDPG
ncbi:DUF4062 domain-containing protein [Rhizobium lusitanum]|uniref:DUF4062 domain-containing protein n=1 Tax=Rhizobium lusitanum TaxID=293958 RepID=UPI00161B2AF5|nr:DUF4062 domain-containing protein [Rhizobium lusitanum]QND50127.1 DUF4062 domain-containing protein [Rhizobium lusitanum]